MQRSFPGKVILFGEYSIIAGSQALIVPLESFSGRLVHARSTGPAGQTGTPGKSRSSGRMADSRRELWKFLSYLSEGDSGTSLKGDSGTTPKGFQGAPGVLPDRLDLEKMRADLESGMFFDSDIPSGSGAGSSAAMVAAVYDRYAREPFRKPTGTESGMMMLRDSFARMESHFHGHSSGIDPLCSYTGMPVHVSPRSIRKVDIPDLPANYRFLLVDSGIKGKTGPLVRNFKQRLEDEPAYALEVRERYSSLVNTCIDMMLKGNTENLPAKIRLLSEMQYGLFPGMIPEGFRRYWDKLLENDLAIPKLCGSGGGGFFLLFTDDPGKLERIASLTGKALIHLRIGEG